MGIHGTDKAAYLRFGTAISNNRLLDYKWFMEQEVDTWNQWVSLPLRRRFELWRSGFTSPCGKLYDFETHGRELYLSELDPYRLYRSLNGHHRYLIDDKLSQHWMMADYPENRPTAYGIVDRGRIHGVAGTEFDSSAFPISDWLPEALQRESSLVLKQVRGMGGKQVVVCEFDDGYVLDGQPVTDAGVHR